MIEGAEPDAVKAASPVLNGEVEETGRKTLRLDLTQRIFAPPPSRTPLGPDQVVAVRSLGGLSADEVLDVLPVYV